ICTSLWNLAASCVSFADARACSPSLLTISTSGWCIGGYRFELQHAFTAARNGLPDQRVHLLRSIRERTHQHRQVHTGDTLDVAGLQQFDRKITRRRAENVREDKDAVAGVKRLHCGASV